MLSVICFSKDRPLQLEAYLQSLIWYSGIPASLINVIYVESPEISYDRLRQRYPEVNWRREVSFYTDLLDIIRTSHDHVLLGCDDVFFTDHFDVNIALERLTNDPTLFGFSLRLGLNLHSLPDVSQRSGVLDWDWTQATNGHWSYPWDVSASVYRRVDVEHYLITTPRATNPNRFESIRAKALETSRDGVAPRLASFIRSKCLTLTVNRVQDEFPNEFDDSRETDIQSLYRAHLSGRQLDWPSFDGTHNKVIHVDASYFRLCDEIAPPSILLQDIVVQPTTVWLNHRQLRLKVFFWKYFIKIKEAIRPFISRSLMRVLRKILGMN
jgi:hypothetical protein